MVGNRNELRIERLLQSLEVFDGILEHVFIIKTILEGIAAVLFGEVASIKEVIVAPLFIGGISIPETSSIPMENSARVVTIF